MALIAPEALAAAKLAVNRGAEAAGFRNALQAGLDVSRRFTRRRPRSARSSRPSEPRRLKAALAWRKAQFKE